MSDPLSLSTAWPAARPTGISPIQHPAWEEARNAILDLAAEGPITAVIVGEPGTGKTWLLRELASALGDHGFPTMMLMQGNLPMTLSSGAALLVDEASLMNASMRAEMSAQEHGVVILASVEWFEDELDPASPSPVVIRLRPLQLDEIANFATEWLHRAGLPPIADPETLFRLADRSGGRIATIVQLLTETVATRIPPPAARAPEPVAEKRPETPAIPPAPKPVAPPRQSATPRRRSLYRPLVAGSAIAATIVLGWTLLPAPPPTTIAQPPTPPPAVADATATAPAPLPPSQQAVLPAQTVIADAPQPALTNPTAAAPSSLPPLRNAETPNPALATASSPTRPTLATPSLIPAPTPNLDVANIPVETETPTPFPAIAAAPPPAVLSPADPIVVATLEDPTQAITAAPPRQLARTGGPGLVLIAQRGDTLASLYGSVYRDRKAPPFAIVLAANPRPFKAGSIVVFPEPPGGWQRVQR